MTVLTGRFSGLKRSQRETDSTLPFREGSFLTGKLQSWAFTFCSAALDVVRSTARSLASARDCVLHSGWRRLSLCSNAAVSGSVDSVSVFCCHVDSCITESPYKL
jgi:hypothetical protein